MVFHAVEHYWALKITTVICYNVMNLEDNILRAVTYKKNGNNNKKKRMHESLT